MLTVSQIHAAAAVKISLQQKSMGQLEITGVVLPELIPLVCAAMSVNKGPWMRPIITTEIQGFHKRLVKVLCFFFLSPQFFFSSLPSFPFLSSPSPYSCFSFFSECSLVSTIIIISKILQYTLVIPFIWLAVM